MRTYKDAGCTLNHTEGALAESAIPISLVGLYSEQIMCNYTGEPIYCIDASGKRTEIPTTPAPHFSGARHVHIMHRTVNGSRHVIKGKVEGKSDLFDLTIKFDTLLAGPVYIPELAIVIASARHQCSAINPASSAHLDELFAKLYDKLELSGIRNPVTVLANDPSGKHKRMYMIVNHEVVAIPVDHCNSYKETDRVSFIRRLRETDDSPYVAVVRETTIADMLRMKEKTWEIDGHFISLVPDVLHARLNGQKAKPDPKSISMDDHNRIIAERLAEKDSVIEIFKDKLRVCEEQVKTDKREITKLEKDLKQATDGGYAENAGLVREQENRLKDKELTIREKDLSIKELTLELDKARAANTQVGLRIEEKELTIAEKTTHHKVWTERLKTIGLWLGSIGGILAGAVALVKALPAAWAFFNRAPRAA